MTVQALEDHRPASVRCCILFAVLGGFALLGSLGLWNWERDHGAELWAFVKAHVVDRDQDFWATRFWDAASDLGHGYCLAAVIVTLTVIYGSRRFLQDAIFVTVGASVATNLLKVVVDRARPGGGAPHSWPSGHATGSFALALCCVTRPRWFAIALPIALLACLARVMRERHWPSDVLGGFGIALLATALLMHIRPLVPQALCRLPMRLVFGFGLFAYAIGELAFGSYRGDHTGYLQLMVQPLVLVAASRACRLADQAHP